MVRNKNPPDNSRDRNNSNLEDVPETQDQTVSSSTNSVSHNRSRYVPSTLVMREVRRLQIHSQMHIPALTFQRLVREIVEDSGITIPFQAGALGALQAAAENFLIDLFMNNNSLTSANINQQQSEQVTVEEEEVRPASQSPGEDNQNQ